MSLLTMIRYTEQGIRIEQKDREDHLFSTREKAEYWLKKNGFSYRPRTFLKGDPLSWCHEKEEAWDFIDVRMVEHEVDDETPFSYEPKEAPWRAAARRDGFIELMQEQGFSPEQIKEAYEDHFGEKFRYKLN